MDCGARRADLHVHVQRVDGQERTIRWTVKAAAASDSLCSSDFTEFFDPLYWKWVKNNLILKMA